MKQLYKKTKKKTAQCILAALMAFFDKFGPIWNFFFVKTPNPDENYQTTNKIS